MKAIFINSTNTITTVEEMENAIAAIFWWRVDTGVDFPIMYDEPYFEPLFPGFCTIETTRLYEIYINYMYNNCCDARPMHYYPLIDNIILWMDETYGNG